MEKKEYLKKNFKYKKATNDWLHIKTTNIYIQKQSNKL